MKSRKAWTAGLVAFAAWMPAARAQAPGVSALGGLGGASSAGAATSAVGGVTTAAQPTTLWSFLGLSGNNLAACKAKICASQLGQMANSMVTGPLGAITGGFLPSLCPPPTAAQAAALANQGAGAQSTAAKIQADEAGAKARVAAVEYLGTVDCSRWPEATTALVNALLDDKNECVRFAAAKALNSGCCCNKETIEALRICVAGESKKGNAPETSPRVKAAAFAALQNCLMKVPEDLPEEKAPPPTPPKPESSQSPFKPVKPPTPEGAMTNPADGTHIATAYTEAAHGHTPPAELVPQKSFTRTVDDARRALFQVSRTSRQPNFLPTGKRSVFGVLAKSREDAKAATLQHAREQALQGSPNTVDPGVAPASFTPAAPAIQGNLTPAVSAEPMPVSSIGGEDRQGASDAAAVASGNSNARRGLIGMLFQPHDRVSDQ